MIIRTILLAFLSALLISQFAQAQEGLKTLKSNYDVKQTTERLTENLENSGATVFEVIDHQQGAASVNLELPATTVVIFGNPKLGTPIMQCSPSAAIDLPQKILIWEENDDVIIGYNDPDYFKKRHQIEGCDQELNKISKVLKKFARSAAGNNQN